MSAHQTTPMIQEDHSATIERNQSEANTTDNTLEELTEALYLASDKFTQMQAIFDVLRRHIHASSLDYHLAELGYEAAQRYAQHLSRVAAAAEGKGERS